MKKKNDSHPILIAGLGSIGRRHFRNLIKLGFENIILYRTGKSTLPLDEFSEVTTFSSLEEALNEKPQAAIIANPTSMHIPTALKVASSGCHIFLEKPVSHNFEGVDELWNLCNKMNLHVLVGFQFRFHPILKQIKAWIDANVIGSVVSAHAHWGEDVKSWHPWENYKESYSVRSDLGGGAILTLSHPIDYLYWLFGDVEKVYATTLTTRCIDSDVESVAQIVLHFKTGSVGSVYLDYLQRPARHTLDIVGNKGFVTYDFYKGSAKLFKNGELAIESIAPDGNKRNSIFIAQLEHFLNCIKGESSPICPLKDGAHVLKIALAAKQSSSKGRAIYV